MTTYGPKTLSYSEEAKGWPSFYSFMPEQMIGMNSYFYSFKGGNLYRHNTNELRNNYYNIQYSSDITGVFNTEPQTIKLFKTMSYESDEAWAVTSLFTELGTGSMLATYFQQKEREWFTFLRENEPTVNFRARSANGIGNCTTVGGIITANVISFGVNIGTIITAGDYLCQVVGGVTTYRGQVIDVDRVNNTVTVDCTISDLQGTGGSPATATTYTLFYKNAQAESHGARGYFMQFTLENSSTEAVELFSVGSSVMKSYP